MKLNLSKPLCSFGIKSDTIINWDCRTLLRKMRSDSVDICITSPPYKKADGACPALFKEWLPEQFRVQKSNSLFFLNVGHLAEDKYFPFRVCEYAMQAGYQLNETILWVKSHYRPIQGHTRLNNITEFIFLMHKGKMPQLDRLAIGVPYADKSNVNRFAKGVDLKCGANVWLMNYATIQKASQKLHNDRFPEALPENCLKLAALPKGSLVLDCFSGSGTTALVAKRMGYKYLGAEINAAHHRDSLKRLQNA